MDPKNVLKAPMAPIYTKYEEGARRKNAIFWSKFSKKCLQTPFFGLFFFQNYACAAENLVKTGTKQCSGRARKINLADLKKGRQKFRKFFENQPPSPRENSRSAPGSRKQLGSLGLYPLLIKINLHGYSFRKVT